MVARSVQALTAVTRQFERMVGPGGYLHLAYM